MADQITQTGLNMAAALFRIQRSDPYAQTEISRNLNQFLPNFIDVQSLDDRENKQFIIKLTNEDGREFTSRTLSEGTLRLLALCILLQDERHQGLLCFEEPENGIHPGRIASALELLIDLSIDFTQMDQPLRQVIVNTHSPVIVSATLKWKGDRRVSVWLSQLVTLVQSFAGRRLKIGITKMLPVEQTSQTTLVFSDAEKKWTMMRVEEYLKNVGTDEPASVEAA